MEVTRQPAEHLVPKLPLRPPTVGHQRNHPDVAQQWPGRILSRRPYHFFPCTVLTNISPFLPAVSASSWFGAAEKPLLSPNRGCRRFIFRSQILGRASPLHPSPDLGLELFSKHYPEHQREQRHQRTDLQKENRQIARRPEPLCGGASQGKGQDRERTSNPGLPQIGSNR